MEHHANFWTARLIVDRGEFERIGAEFLREGIVGWEAREERIVDIVQVRFAPKENLVVDTGVTRSLDKLFGIGGPPAALATIGVDDGASNPVAGTTNSTAGSSNRRLVSFGTPTRSAKVVTASGVFTNSNSNFVHKRLFLSAAAAGTTDAAGDLAAMTNVFTIDLTGFSSFSQTYSATYTGAGS